LKKLREGDNEAVIVPKRECRDCGTVFEPAVPQWLMLITIPFMLGLLAFAVWGVFINDRVDEGTVHSAAWVAFLFALCVAFATFRIRKQRVPKFYSGPRQDRDTDAPWNKYPRLTVS
jgi:hypothetical protein